MVDLLRMLPLAKQPATRIAELGLTASARSISFRTSNRSPRGAQAGMRLS